MSINNDQEINEKKLNKIKYEILRLEDLKKNDDSKAAAALDEIQAAEVASEYQQKIRDDEERLDRAFRYDANPEKEEEFQKCIDTFNAYVRGGIGYMYNLFTSGCTSRDDYIRAAFETIRNYKDSMLLRR